MKKVTYQYPHSSFLSIEKDLDIIVNTLMKNENLKKLLYYTDKACLSKPKLTEDQSIDLINKNIKIVPKLSIDSSVLNYIMLSFNNFFPNATNPEFRDNSIEFDIICHFDQWQLNDLKLRPYRIAAEIDTMFNDKHLTGIGTLEFMYCRPVLLTDEFAGLCLVYNAIHGEEDKVGPLNPADEKSLINNFEDIFNE